MGKLRELLYDGFEEVSVGTDVLLMSSLSLSPQSTLTTISSWLFSPDARSWFLPQVSPEKPH